LNNINNEVYVQEIAKWTTFCAINYNKYKIKIYTNNTLEEFEEKEAGVFRNIKLEKMNIIYLLKEILA
jgi:hypothetical protein